MKKHLTIVVLTLLVLSTFVLIANVPCTRSSPDTHIVPDEYPTIQYAIDNVTVGDTIYVRAGTYYESLNIWKPLTLTGENRNTTIIDGTRVTNVITVEANHVTISGFTVRKSRNAAGYAGIYVSGYDYLNVSDSNLVNNYDGIFMEYSNYGTLANNNISQNQYAAVYAFYSLWGNFSNNLVAGNLGGIALREGTHYSSVAQNIVLNNSNVGIQISSEFNSITANMVANNNYGIDIYPLGMHNVFTDNNVTLSGYCGLYLLGASNNTFVGNNFSANSAIGICLGPYYSDVSSHNTFARNNITYNGNTAIDSAGIYIDINTNDNLFYHNNIIGNTMSQVYLYDTLNTVNAWDNGYPSGGNYWSDYAGADSYSGLYQNITGSDGIVDTPRFIIPITSRNNNDSYPLTSTWPQDHFRVTWIPNPIPDPTLPPIHLSMPRERDPVDITASIMINQRMPDQVLLSYDVNDSPWWNTTMEYDIANDLWRSTIPPQPGMSEVKVEILAIDNANGKNMTPTCTYTVKSVLNADINGDGKVDGKDLGYVAWHFGEPRP
jgi:nitrous oxidase accessory protein